MLTDGWTTLTACSDTPHTLANDNASLTATPARSVPSVPTTMTLYMGHTPFSLETAIANRRSIQADVLMPALVGRRLHRPGKDSQGQGLREET